MDGLELLGVVDTALANQFITLRVKGIDRDKLKQKLGGTAAAGLFFVDASPKAALDAAMPLVVSKAREYGADVEATVSNAPPVGGKRPVSEFWPGLAIGVGIGGASLAIVKLFARLLGR